MLYILRSRKPYNKSQKTIFNQLHFLILGQKLKKELRFVLKSLIINLQFFLINYRIQIKKTNLALEKINHS